MDCSLEEAAKRGTPQRIVYAGKAGTGFTEKTLESLMTLLRPMVQPENPFAIGWPRFKPPLYFVAPKVVGQFEFTESTNDGYMRHSVYKGLRSDKAPADVVRED